MVSNGNSNCFSTVELEVIVGSYPCSDLSMGYVMVEDDCDIGTFDLGAGKSILDMILEVLLF